MARNRKRLYKHEAEILGIKVKKNDKGRKNAQYDISLEDWALITAIRQAPNEREFVTTQKKRDKNGKVISSLEKFQSEPIEVPEGFEISKISTSKTTGQQWVQYLPKNESKSLSEIDLESITKKYIKPLELPKIEIESNFDFDTLTYTDMHLGMETNSKGNAMYAEEWNREEALNFVYKMAKDVLTFRRTDKLIVDDLGDFLDGFDGYTTRRGHKLPQNMTNEEMYDAGVEFKVTLLELLVKHFKTIQFNNVCNDNHAGSFGYFVNQHFKSIAELKYSNVTVNNSRTFLSHYFVENICFVYSHGKDDETLKFGFKPQLDTKQIEKIDQYLKQNKIYGKAERIIFKKGDSHQTLFDMCGSDDFDYYNYPAGSPSSQWVQNNFKKGRRGFVIDNFIGKINSMTPIFI